MRESKACATLHHVGWGGDHDNVEIVDLVLNGRRIATMEADQGNLIVRAVNAHDALVAACEAAHELLCGPINPIDRKIVASKLYAAIKLANGGAS